MKILYILILSLLTSIGSAQLVWQPNQVITTVNGVNRPRIAQDANGNPLVIWGENSNLMFSKWSAGTLTPPTRLNPVNHDVAEAFWQGPEMAAKGDTVYIVYKLIPETDTTKHIYCIRSFDGGQTFNQPVRVDFIGQNMGRLPTVAVDDAGNPIVAFMMSDVNYHEPQWVVVTSSDYGQSFSQEVQASGFNSTSAEACDCCPGALSVLGSKIVLAYRDNNNDIRDIWLGISENSGQSFYNTPADVSNWFVQACPSSGPDINLKGDSVVTVYMNGANQTRTYLSYFSMADSSLSFTPLEAGNSIQNYPRSDMDGQNLAVVWKSSVGTQQMIKMNFIENGSFYPYNIDTGTVNVPDISLKGNQLYVVWHDVFSKSIMLKKAEKGFIDQSEVTAKKISVWPNPTSEYIRITSEEHIARVEMADLQGRRVLLILNPDNVIKVANLPRGSYILKLISGNQTVFEKLTLQ